MYGDSIILQLYTYNISINIIIIIKYYVYCMSEKYIFQFDLKTELKCKVERPYNNNYYSKTIVMDSQ